MSTSTNSVLKNALERLEDTLTSPVLRQNGYQDLRNAVNAAEAIDKETAKRLLAVCIHDLNEDIKYATNASTILGALLVKIKKGQCATTPTLVESAISVISLLKNIASANQFDALKGILFNTLLSYPDNTLICVVAESTDKVIELLIAYINAGNKLVPITFLITLLKILPPANKITFVKEALMLWFTKVIPLAVACIRAEIHLTSCVEILELVTDILVDIEYAENEHWKILIECIYNPKKYPSIMKSMLENRSEFWHRLWIVFIKLLKDQITKVSNSSGSPINAMLPVVEAAFKMDPVNRCRAFQCWTVLIDNFSKESNEAYVNKRLKLLLIPLKSSNAKVEETAISKFNTWWHLIRQFHSKMEGLTDMILMPFIHFCFGKTAAKSPVAPGQSSKNLKELSLQAFVEIFGHVDCEGCINIPKLKSRLMSTKILVDHWNEWISCYKVAVTTVLESNSEKTLQQITCLWKSLVMTVGELPENNIRKDLFNELLALISLLAQGCQNIKLADIVMNILIKSLFEDDNKIKSLLVTKETGPMYMILPLLSSSFSEKFYRGKTVDELVLFFKPITTFMMKDDLCCPNRITTWLLKHLPANDNTLLLWIALVEAVCESKHDLAEATLASILSYPIQKLNAYSYEKTTVAAYKWFETYCILGPKLGNVNFDKECLEIILEQTDLDSSPAKKFMLHVSLALVKHKLLQKIDDDCANITQIFLNAMNSIDTYSSIEKVFPALIDTLVLMGSKLKDNINVSLAKTFVSTLKLTMKLLLQQTINDTTIIFVEKMLLSLLDILKVKEYQDLALIMNEEILACSSITRKHASKIKLTLSTLTLHLPNNKNRNLSELSEQKSSATVTGHDENIKKVTENPSIVKEFNTPNVNYCKKSNKRAASIVNTVVENGEEYVVVKSNWKFNPRKLTENQKEKLKRKREDIPALYQDLSQSQDEFKLHAWKPDSQDATTTSSKSTSKSNNEDAATILNQIPNTDIVPRIFENMLGDGAKNNDSDKNSVDNAVVNNNTSNAHKQSITTKEAKSPRMALKDRVFRNVRNLVEKSSLPQEVTVSLLTEDMNKTVNENAAKTPTNKAKISATVVNSAPPKIVSERPSRVIKKPKKFDDSELISLKKRRQSQDARNDASDSNNLKKKQKSQVMSVDESEKTCLKTTRESLAPQSDDPVISSKSSQESQYSQSDTKIIDLKTKEQSGVDTPKSSNLKKRRQSHDSHFVNPDIISFDDRQQPQESRTDCGEINDLQTKEQFQFSRTDSSEISKLRKRRQSQDSQSVIPEIITLSNTQQLQESQPDTSKIDSLSNSQQSQDSRLDDPKSSLKKRRKSLDSCLINSWESQSDSTDVLVPPDKEVKENEAVVSIECDKDFDDETKIQLKFSQADTSKNSNLNKRRPSQELQSVIPEINTLTNTQQQQESPPAASKISSLKNRRKSQDSRSNHPDINNLKITRNSLHSRLINSSESQSDSANILVHDNKEVKEKDTVVQLEYDKDFGHKNRNIFELNSEEKQDTQNQENLADSQSKRQSVNSVPLQDIYINSQPTEHASNNVPLQIMSLDPKPKEQSTESVSVQDTLPDSQSNEQSTNIPFQDILPESQTKEQSTFITEENKVKKNNGDKNYKKETPTFKTNEKDSDEKSAKKKESRIVKQLLIDMVEGHPLLQAQRESEASTPKRATRKSLLQTTNNNNRRQALSEKLEKFKSDLHIVPLPKSATKTTKKLKASLSPKETVTILSESQEKQIDEITSFSSDDQPMSEDIIESSQDSSITTISVKSSKNTVKKEPLVILNKADLMKTSVICRTSQDEYNDDIISLSDSLPCDQENKEDSQFPKNVTVDKPELDLTENMDTQPVRDRESYSDVICVSNEQELIVINTENTFKVQNTQETAEADTEPMDVTFDKTKTCKTKINSETDFVPNTNTQDDSPKSISETLESLDPNEQNYSPSKDEPERKQDFLDNTQEISPIKTLSPIREKHSPSPESNSDYVVIKLTSPVNSNGEPYEKCNSPEIFTEDKISPEKMNESPPRVDVIVTNTSPSSSLSFKKNRPQRRAGGRAAQMLDLCAVMNNDDSVDSTDNRRNTAANTPAKRNLKSLYSSSVVDARQNTDIESGSVESGHFLEFKKSLPTANSSPAGPILKRKFTEITDETTSSPANKRKRVSFHDPPVSTTVAVQKYIEPGAIRSPQQSTIKRRDRTIRNHTAMKSPKSLETVFKLENVLSNTVESFTEDAVIASIEDTEMSSIEQTPTPALEVVKSSDLNDTAPICPALLSCNDPIENIAADLSSPAMKSLFIKEIEGKVGTIADLAKMTELEINRLCIKAPKVQIARKVLLEYAFKKVTSQDLKLDNEDNLYMTAQKRVEIVHVNAAVQTIESDKKGCGMQTDATPVAFIQTQTDCIPVAQTSAQTDESGYTPTKDVIASCLSERSDFIAQLSKQLEVSTVHMIADNALSFNAVLELLWKKMTIANSQEVTNKVLEVHSKSDLSCNSTQNKLSFVQNYLCNHFDSKDLILFCSQLLQKVYDKPT